MAQKPDAGAKTVLTGPLVWTSERHSILVNGQKVTDQTLEGLSAGMWKGGMGRQASSCRSWAWVEQRGGLVVYILWRQS